MISIYGNTSDEKFASVQQILNQIQLRNLAGSGAKSYFTLKDYWATMPADMIIFRHLASQTSTIKFTFYTGTIDLPNTTLEVTVTDTNNIANVTVYSSTVFANGLEIPVNLKDRIELKVVVTGVNPTDVWITVDGI